MRAALLLTLGMSMMACGRQAAPARVSAPAPQPGPPQADSDELFTCTQTRDVAIGKLAESDRLLRECQVELDSQRRENEQLVTTRPVPVSPEPEHEGGWWCVESLASYGDSGCTRTREACRTLAADIRTATLMVPGRCQWQPRAACFTLHAKLSGTTEEICSSLLSTCDAHRKARRKQTRDFQVRSLCRAR